MGMSSFLAACDSGQCVRGQRQTITKKAKVPLAPLFPSSNPDTSNSSTYAEAIINSVHTRHVFLLALLLYVHRPGVDSGDPMLS